ncbi:MAG: M48 family metalloprotease [Nitrospirota bacterium]
MLDSISFVLLIISILLGFIGGRVSFPLTPLFSYLSRRHEKEADKFAAEMTENPEAMATSLIKLSKDNLSNLYPHPLYASFYYSHPPVVKRIREIMGEEKYKRG